MSDQTQTADLRWEWHDPTFASLMLGRIELAQINQGRVTGDWFWTLRFTEGDERPSFSSLGEHEAQQVCEEHARRVLS